MLAYPNFQCPFELHTNASTTGFGTALYQCDHDQGILHPIAFASRSLNSTEANYLAHKLEFLALKWAVTIKFHEYLYGNEFTVHTNNNPLTYVLSTAKLDTVGQWWVAALAVYNFQLVYKQGKFNQDADTLSQIQWPAILKHVNGDMISTVCHMVEEGPIPVVETLALSEGLVNEHFDNPSLAQVVQVITDQDWVQAQEEDATIAWLCSHLKDKSLPLVKCPSTLPQVLTLSSPSTSILPMQ